MTYEISIGYKDINKQSITIPCCNTQSIEDIKKLAESLNKISGINSGIDNIAIFNQNNTALDYLYSSGKWDSEYAEDYHNMS